MSVLITGRYYFLLRYLVNKRKFKLPVLTVWWRNDRQFHASCNFFCSLKISLASKDVEKISSSELGSELDSYSSADDRLKHCMALITKTFDLNEQQAKVYHISYLLIIKVVNGIL